MYVTFKAPGEQRQLYRECRSQKRRPRILSTSRCHVVYFASLRGLCIVSKRRTSTWEDRLAPLYPLVKISYVSPVSSSTNMSTNFHQKNGSDLLTSFSRNHPTLFSWRSNVTLQFRQWTSRGPQYMNLSDSVRCDRRTCNPLSLIACTGKKSGVFSVSFTTYLIIVNRLKMLLTTIPSRLRKSSLELWSDPIWFLQILFRHAICNSSPQFDIRFALQRGEHILYCHIIRCLLQLSVESNEERSVGFERGFFFYFAQRSLTADDLVSGSIRARNVVYVPEAIGTPTSVCRTIDNSFIWIKGKVRSVLFFFFFPDIFLLSSSTSHGSLMKLLLRYYWFRNFWILQLSRLHSSKDVVTSTRRIQLYCNVHHQESAWQWKESRRYLRFTVVWQMKKFAIIFDKVNMDSWEEIDVQTSLHVSDHWLISDNRDMFDVTLREIIGCPYHEN